MRTQERSSLRREVTHATKTEGQAQALETARVGSLLKPAGADSAAGAGPLCWPVGDDDGTGRGTDGGRPRGHARTAWTGLCQEVSRTNALVDYQGSKEVNATSQWGIQGGGKCCCYGRISLVKATSGELVRAQTGCGAGPSPGAHTGMGAAVVTGRAESGTPGRETGRAELTRKQGLAQGEVPGAREPADAPAEPDRCAHCAPSWEEDACFHLVVRRSVAHCFMNGTRS